MFSFSFIKNTNKIFLSFTFDGMGASRSDPINRFRLKHASLTVGDYFVVYCSYRAISDVIFLIFIFFSCHFCQIIIKDLNRRKKNLYVK